MATTLTEHRKPARRKWLWFAMLALVVAALAAANMANVKRTPEVAVAKAERGVLAETIYAGGRLQPAAERSAFAASGGTVASVRVAEGDAVKKGDLLVAFDTRDWESELRKAQVELEIARLKRETEREAAFEAARRDRDPARIERAIEADKDAQRLHELQIRQLEWAIEDLERRIAESAVAAPMDGVVVFVGAKEGETVPQGFEAARIADVSKLVLEASLNELDAGKVKTGMAAVVTGDAFEGEYEGELTYIAPSAKPSESNAGDYEAPIRVTVKAPASAGLKPGFAATAAIALEGEERTLVPTEAVRFEGEQSYVFKVEDGRAVRADIATGRDDGERIEALSGVEAGDAIVVPAPDGLRDGDEVKAAGGV